MTYFQRATFSLLMVAGLPTEAPAMSLSEAIALADRSNPSIAQSNAQADAAGARLSQAEAGRLPTVVLSGQSGWGTTDLGGFFGFGRSNVSPRGASLEVRQPLFNGGAITTAIQRARDGRDAALALTAGARAFLAAQVAQAYVGVLDADRLASMYDTQARQLAEIASQAGLKFKDGEVPRTDLDQANARSARARADLARAEGDIARARSRFLEIVGAQPERLEPLPPPPATPASLEEAIDTATHFNPTVVAAEAAARAARAGVRFAEAERLPRIDLAATASTTRDQFFPGYQADGVTVGVQGHWTLFSGGLVSGRINEARADVREAEAALDLDRARVRDAVIDAWQDLMTAQAVHVAAADETRAALSALDSVRNEVRVGQKATIDLLDAQRESLAAQSSLVIAEGEQLVDAYRLNALLRGD